jgi:hypothetical protein
MAIYEMLHGTSAAFLESIKQNGLISDSKTKIWSDYSKATYDNPSCKSLNGIYFTNNLNTALAAAANAATKYPGDVLIISAQIDSSTALADEDNIWCWVETWLEKTFLKAGFKPEEAEKFLAFIESQSTKTLTYWIKWFSENLHSELTEEIKCHINYELLSEVFYVALARRASHIFNQDQKLFATKYQSHHKLFQIPQPIKSVDVAEEEYLNAIEKLTIYYTESCIKISNLHTLRVPTSIGFYGKNYIKGMIVINNYEVKQTIGNIAFVKDKLLHHKNFALGGI